MRFPQWNAEAKYWRAESHFFASRSCQLIFACSNADSSRGDGACGSEFQSNIMPCALAARRLPSGLNCTHCTGVVRPPRVTISEPLGTSHTFTVMSLLDDAKRRPSGLNATLVTTPLCPPNSRTSLPVEAFQIRI